MFVKARKGFELFSTGTSMHGFAELYQSKTVFWKICWSIILFAALLVTTYQIWQSVDHFISEPTSTEILPAKETDIFYPPLKLCFTHWLFWVDWKKATVSLKLKRETILYGLSYINTMYSSTKFDFLEEQLNFDRMMLDNNFTSIIEFFSFIARDVPLVGDNNLAKYFDSIEIMYKEPSFLFCYKISGKQIYKYFSDNWVLYENGDNDKTLSFTTPDETYDKVKDYVTVEEYNNYMLRWISIKSMYKIKSTNMNQNFTTFALPIWVYPNGYNKKSVDVYTENDIYSVNMQASARTLKNSPRNVCAESYTSFNSDKTCQMKCRAEKLRSTCSCLALDTAFILNSSSLEALCQKDFTFITAEGNVQQRATNQTYSKQYCPQDPNASLAYEECLQKCILPCTIWTYDFTMSVTRMTTIVRQLGTKSTTNISIEYPHGSTVLMLTEVDSLTWENFIASVGGLLGIWTGASIISFLQVFYLCCFSDSEGCNFVSCIKLVFNRLFVRQKQKVRNIAVMYDNAVLH